MPPPRWVRLLPTDGLVESITQCASAVPLPVNECTAPPVVATLPPTWMKIASPVGTLYPGHAVSGFGNSPPPYLRSGTVCPFPHPITGDVPPPNPFPPIPSPP